MKTFQLLWLAILMLLSSVSDTVDSANILALSNIPSPSHFIFNKVLFRALATRGHQVTVISPDIDKDAAIPNLKYIHLEGVYEGIREDHDFEAFTDLSFIGSIYAFFNMVSYSCEKSFQSKGIQEILNSPSTQKYDLIITEAAWGECFFGFIPKFGYPPVVALSAYGVIPTVGMIMGTSFNPSYMPATLVDFTENTLFQRLKNFVAHNIYVFLYFNEGIPMQEEIARKYFKQDMPSFAGIQSNFSIFLANTVFGFDEAIPLSPNVIPVGGMHIKTKPDPLPKDLQKFLDEAKDGFIFFSLGSNFQGNDLPMEKRQAILDAFSELPQRVLWKFETDDLTGFPPNVKTGKWLPQSDILAHPNIRMFISHCGKMSSSETVHRGVPVVGVPLFADQFSNLEVLISKGVAVKVDYTTLTKQSFLKSIQEILNNNSYQTNMKKLSAIYREHPVTALDSAIFWTEYVIKHGGAPHLRPAGAALPMHQFLLLDVVLIIATGILLIVVALCCIFKRVYNMFTKKSPNKKKTN